MELSDVDLDEKPRPPRTVSINTNPNPLANKRGSAISPASRTSSLKVQERSDPIQTSNEIEVATDQLLTVEIEDKPRPPRAMSMNTNPNPLAIRRGSALSARSQSPKPSDTPNPESSEYAFQLKQFLEAESTEVDAEVPSNVEEEKPRAPRTLSINSNAANPLAQRRGSSVKTSLRLAPPATIVEESASSSSSAAELVEGNGEISQALVSGAPPTSPPPPPPLPSSPAPQLNEEDMVRPSIALSFGGLYAVRPSMIETEYVSDRERPDREFGAPAPERLSVIRESESDNTYENVYDTRASTIAVERPVSVAPPVPLAPPPSAPPVPLAPPPEVPSTQPPPPPAPSSPPPPSTTFEHDSDSDDLPSTSHTNASSANISATNNYTPNSTTYSSVAHTTAALTTVPLHYPTPSGVAVELTSLAWKLCPSVTIMWQERYLVLKKDGSIHYYMDKDTYTKNFAPRGVICISDIQRVKGGLFLELAQNKLNIGVNSKNSRVYKLKFGTAEEAKKWHDAIMKYVRL